MRFIKTLLIFTTAILFLVACEKENSYEGGIVGPSDGTLKSDGGGNCLPNFVNGIYKAGRGLGSTNYIDVQLNVTTPGSYVITTDTINGIYFKALGIISTAGNNTVRLMGGGTPIAVGPFNYTVKYDSSTCVINILTVPANTLPGIYKLNGHPDSCLNYNVNGTYKVGVALNPTNSITFNTNVSIPGTYNLAVQSFNGMLFSGSGVFLNAGVNSVTLSGFGTPLEDGIWLTQVSSDTLTKCRFALIVLPASGTSAAVFSMGGGGGSCANFTSSGTYTAGTPMSGANTVKVNVIVSSVGAYTIASNTINGVTFLGMGNFSATGTQSVTLTATGTPTAAGAFNFAVTGGSSTCNFPLTFN
ncbi:MAG: hypothetical protein IPL97_12095 [Niastella sp.]|nr:hypothetical protein [Niastella sp.]